MLPLQVRQALQQIQAAMPKQRLAPSAAAHATAPERPAPATRPSSLVAHLRNLKLTRAGSGWQF